MRTAPLIGLTLDSEPPGGYSNLPWYALRQNYFDAVAAAGGWQALRVLLPTRPPTRVEVDRDALARLLGGTVVVRLRIDA